MPRAHAMAFPAEMLSRRITVRMFPLSRQQSRQGRSPCIQPRYLPLSVTTERASAFPSRSGGASRQARVVPGSRPSRLANSLRASRTLWVVRDHCPRRRPLRSVRPDGGNARSRTSSLGRTDRQRNRVLRYVLWTSSTRAFAVRLTWTSVRLTSFRGLSGQRSRCSWSHLKVVQRGVGACPGPDGFDSRAGSGAVSIAGRNAPEVPGGIREPPRVCRADRGRRLEKNVDVSATDGSLSHTAWILSTTRVRNGRLAIGED